MTDTTKKDITVKIAEGEVEVTLTRVLKEVVKQNKVCTVLTTWRIEGLGTGKPSLVMSFDEAACESAPPAA